VNTIQKSVKTITHDLENIPKPIKWVVFIIFIRMMGWGFVDPYFSIYLSGFNNSYSAIGSLISIFSLTSLLFTLPLIRLADKIQGTRLMQDGEIIYLITVIMYMIAGYTHVLPLLILAFIANGIGLSLIVVGSESFIRKHSQLSSSSRSFGYYTALNYLGWIIGMLMGALLVNWYNFNTMFLFVIPSILISFWIFPKIHEHGDNKLMKSLGVIFRSPLSMISWIRDFKNFSPRLAFFLVLAFFDGMVVMFTYVFIPLFALSLNLNLREIALLMAVMYMPFILSFIISEITDRVQKSRIIVLSLILATVAFIHLMIMVDQKTILILAAMTSLSLAILRPAYNGVITHLTPRRMLGEVSGLNDLVFRFGNIVGPVLTGFIAEKWSLQVAFGIVASMALILGIVSLFFKTPVHHSHPALIQSKQN